MKKIALLVAFLTSVSASAYVGNELDNPVVNQGQIEAAKDLPQTIITRKAANSDKVEVVASKSALDNQSAEEFAKSANFQTANVLASTNELDAVPNQASFYWYWNWNYNSYYPAFYYYNYAYNYRPYYNWYYNNYYYSCYRWW